MSVLDFGWSFTGRLTLSQTLYFSLHFPGELARVLRAGLATQDSINSDGSSSSGAVSTMAS